MSERLEAIKCFYDAFMMIFICLYSLGIIWIPQICDHIARCGILNYIYIFIAHDTKFT